MHVQRKVSHFGYQAYNFSLSLMLEANLFFYRKYYTRSITDYQFITNGTCQDFGCRELNIQECKRYGMLKAIEFIPVKTKVSVTDGKPAPDHCVAKGGSQLYFNQYKTRNSASSLRKKLCACRGLFRGKFMLNSS